MSASYKKSKPSYQVDDLSLHPNIIQKLKEANLLTFKRILHLSFAELQKIAKISAAETKSTLKAVSLALLESEPVLAFDIRNNCEKPCKLLALDVMKNADTDFRGIFTGTITEICGESGCGKTQLCLYLSILAQLPTALGGLNSKVVYVHTEGDFPIKRFMQLATAFKRVHPDIRTLNLSSNLILKKVHNLNAMMHVLQNGIPDLITKANPQLIVIDSVAALLRSDYESISARTSAIQKFGTEIWKLANVYGLAVICVNQVSGRTQQKEATKISNMSDVPSLGLLWSNILTTRLKISRKASEQGMATRVLECIYSSYHPHIAVNFIISETGLKAL